MSEQAGTKIPPRPKHEPDVHRRARTMRGDWWRVASSPRTDGSQTAEEPTEGSPDWWERAADTPEDGAKAQGVNPPAQTPDEPAQVEDAQTEDDAKGPEWDPVHLSERLAGRAIRAHHKHPVTERLRGFAANADAPPRLGRLFYVATGIWASWHVGLTPALLDLTANAHPAVPIGMAVIGWAIYRRTDNSPLFIAWAGHAIWTATVINLTPHL